MIERIIVEEKEPDHIFLKLQHELEKKYQPFRKGMRSYRHKRMNFRDLTQFEIEYIRENYHTKSVPEIADYLNISKDVIYGRIRRKQIIIQ